MKPASPIAVLRAIHAFFRQGTPIDPSAMFDETRTFKQVVNDCLPTSIEAERAQMLAEDISWLRTMRADYANLVESIGTDEEHGEIDQYVSSWDQDAHDECLTRTLRACTELEKLYPHDEG